MTEERDESDTINEEAGYCGVRADIQQPESGSPSSTLGDYVIFVDESGDACLDLIYPRSPMLNLVFCIIRRDHYFEHVVPNLKALKEGLFGHTYLILDESGCGENSRLCAVARSVGPSTLDDRTAYLDQSNRDLSGQRMYR